MHNRMCEFDRIRFKLFLCNHSVAGQILSSRVSLRGVKRRSNPHTRRAGDCFAALAMTSCHCPPVSEWLPFCWVVGQFDFFLLVKG